MINKTLNILLIVTLSTLIYISNSSVINLSIFILMLITILNKNYYSLFSIIPLFFINKTAFVIFLFLWILFYIVDTKIKKVFLKRSSMLLLGLIYLSYEIFINNINTTIIFSLLVVTTTILTLNLFNQKFINQININVLFMFILILNFWYINTYLFLFFYLSFIIIECLLFNKHYYIITAFFISVYTLVNTQNILYIFIQISAYLGYLLNYLKNKKTYNYEIEFILDDINNNITNFCSFLDNFSKITYDNEYEKKLSNSIKILIESFCYTCKDRVQCYANKKIKTYIYLKALLTKENIAISDMIECKYYFLLKDNAKELQQKHNLIIPSNSDDNKIIGICSSIQNYFVSLFEKISPLTIYLIKYKKYLLDLNVNFNNFEYKITNENIFEFKIYSNKMMDLVIIKEHSEYYFKNKKANIDLRDGYVYIYPKKRFKVTYDYAALSLNNCQISGDNILTKTLNDVNFICALSDGMGSGYNAYRLSQETLRMVDSITDCNISFESSLQILNNFFKTRDLSDCYATLDLVDIDLIYGKLNLYKLGSSTTYLSRGEKIIPIYNNNLPFGINDLITKEEYVLSDEDLIILVSDGVNDYIDENTLIKYIESLKNEPPHKIVYEILQKIYHENKNMIKDDMSCIAIKTKEIK